MAKVLDLCGHKYGKLSPVRFIGRDKHGHRVWECLCDCGSTKPVTVNHLRAGNVKSCGCSSKLLEMEAKKRDYRSFTKTYKTWNSMKSRCLHVSNPEYFRYGGAGITICDRWLESFDNFLEDMGERPEGLTIDRVDPQGNYEPNNCRWATANEQSYNQGLSKRNTSGVAGVYWEEKCKKWRVRIQKDNKLLANDYFEDYDTAVEHRLKLEEIHYGRKKQDNIV